MPNVIKAFTDRFDGKVYREGDTYDGDRVEDLTSRGYLEASDTDNKDENKDNTDSEFPKHLGGGYYELSDGSKVRGKDEAADAQAKFDEK